MDEIKKMIRAVINGQSALKQELLGEIKKTNSEVRLIKKEMRDGFRKVNSRLDKQGKEITFQDWTMNVISVA